MVIGETLHRRSCEREKVPDPFSPLRLNRRCDMNSWSNYRMLMLVATIGACSAVIAQSSQKQSQTSTTQPIEKRWNVPGLTETKDDTGVFVMSDRIARHLETQKEVVKSVSRKKDRNVANDDKRYGLLDIWIIAGDRAEWQVDVYQARSRQRAYGIGMGCIEINSARPIANVQWEDKKIGDVSVGYYADGKKTVWGGVVFVRGNVAVQVRALAARDDKYLDARPVAALIDAYLVNGPKGEVNAKKVVPITVAIHEDQQPRGETQATPVVGRAYSIKLAPRAKMNARSEVATQPADGEVIATSEMRIRATHAEIVKEPGAIHVTFLKTGKQTLVCEYIDEDGTVVARGELEVAVDKEPALRSKPGATEPAPPTE